MPATRPNTTLPAAAVVLLRRATQTTILAYDPLARIKAAEQVNQRVESMFPNLFKE